MIPASLAIFACLCVGAACYKLGRHWGYEHGYNTGTLDQMQHCRTRVINAARHAFKSGQAWGIKLAKDMLSISTK